MILALLLLEVEGWELDLFAFDQLQQMLIEQLDVHGLHMFEIELPVLVARRLGRSQKIVVRSDRGGTQPVDAQVIGQPLGKGSLAGGRRTRDEDDLHVGLRRDFVGNLRALLLVQRFRDHHELLQRAAAGGDLVESADGVHAKDAPPLLVFLEDLEQVRLIFERCGFGWVLAGRELKNEAGGIVHQVESREHTRRRHDRTVREIGEIFAPVDDNTRRVTVFQELQLLDLPGLLEFPDGLGVGDFAAADRQVALDRLAHLVFHSLELLRGNAALGIAVVAEVAEEPLAEGVLQGEVGVGVELANGLAEQEAEGAPVDAPSVRVRGREELDLAVDGEGIGEGRDIVVDPRGDVGQAVRSPSAPQQLLYRRSRGTRDCIPILKRDSDSIHVFYLTTKTVPSCTPATTSSTLLLSSFNTSVAS